MKIKFLKASKGDCFLISFQDENNVNRNILIDGGVNETYFDSVNNRDGELKYEIERIRKDKEKVDLLILTHIDNDHILGLLNWFKTDSEAYKLIGNVWFNSGRLISDTFKLPSNEDLDREFKIFKNTDTGVSEAIDFEKYLLDNQIWERKLIRKGMTFSELGVKIEILTPEKKQLKRLLKEYRKKLGENVYTAGHIKDWDESFMSLIQSETPKEIYKKQDYRAANCSSITFILTIQGKKFLFLADGNAIKIANALKEKGYSKQNPIHVEFMKVSHHGSRNNTCKKLLDIIKTDNYLMSTDSTSHGRPNKLSLARILSNNPNAVFHFNYDHVKRAVISKQDFKDFKFLKAFVTKEFPY
ncbi:MBL fold metallo-hydrolase [Labilibaculum euxinus]|uniref:MBL fold metallo-hydrolase n=1 Tax=Labilibaculum euxinus TaxID=2686357 RepID=A0A7M4DB21_9BACT|nr:MBL fold metallo-hydrolase [Labilibaculum euxinus]MUP39850.1 MBL fold metallo-hydrolase [Labilibaculum euxinus]MVB09055.1 MBL fold metallo-hydrolase [Labilibaculum euxinus]